MKKNPINIKASHEGSLRAALGAKPGKNIPVKMLEHAAHSESPAMRKKAQFALNARKWNK